MKMNMKMRKRTFSALLALCMCLMLFPGMVIAEPTTTWYVTETGAGSKDGKSWDNASSNLKDVMNNKAQEGHEIWVAMGTYSPGESEADTFTLKKGVKVYGGFAGGETSLSARNWVDNVTILSGNDVNLHVVTGGSDATPDDTRLDGFTVTGGNANNAEHIESGLQGGGMYNNNSSPTVVNCTFSGNTANVDGGGMSNVAASPTLANTILWGNTAQDEGGADIYQGGGTLTLKNCVVDVDSKCKFENIQDQDLIKQDLINDAPKLKALNKTGGAPATPADVYIYGLDTGSSAIDMGLDIGMEVVADSGIVVPNKDQRGTVRPQGDGVDIGAFEADSAEQTTTWYVTQNGAGSQEGTSWDNASSNLKDVMNNKAQEGHEIWVAMGTYSPGESEADTFTLKKGVKVYGGFAGGEASLSDRNWVDNVTILDGQGNVYHVVTGGSGATPDDTRLDGFTVTGGNANDPYGDCDSNGGGMFNNNSSPTVVNCTFSGNKAINGCGMFNIDANPTLANTILWGNTAQDEGGADIYQNGSTLTVKNCVVGDYILDEANENIEDLIQTNPLLNGVDSDLAPETDPAKIYIYKLDTGSSAIDMGLEVDKEVVENSGIKVPNKDQLGTQRPQGAGVDIGAFEAVYAITSVAVTPDTVSVETGKTQSFIATVTGTGTYNDTVTWSVEGKNSSGTTISDSGVLTVAADENAATLTVKATSNGDSTKSGTATVTVPTQSDPTSPTTPTTTSTSTPTT